ncbi:hypothetical protein [Arsenophonus sp.]|nr:hypothetical protein [Arsenophonus sp.]MDR5615026.1 hypothetical protein [Arsenophonus sp.]
MKALEDNEDFCLQFCVGHKGSLLSPAQYISEIANRRITQKNKNKL